MAQLKIGESGDVAWTPASTTAAGYPGIGLRAQYNSFIPDNDTLFAYKFEGDPDDWPLEVTDSVVDSSDNSNHGTPMNDWSDTYPIAGNGWINQSMNVAYTAWKDPHSTVELPITGLTVPYGNSWTVQWWMKVNGLPRNSNGGILAQNSSISRDNGFQMTFRGGEMQIIAFNGDLGNIDYENRFLRVPQTDWDDDKWHHYRAVFVPGATYGYTNSIYMDGVLKDTSASTYGWASDFVIATPHYLGHYNVLGDVDRQFRWEAGVNADFDEFIFQDGVISDAVSRWKYDGSTAVGCSAVQSVDLGATSTISGVSWAETTASSDERLQSVEIDDGAGYQTIWTYGGAVDVSGLAPASAYDIRITQRHSTDTVHEFAHILESLTLDYEAAGGYRRPPLTYRMGPKMFTGGMI